VPHDRRWKVSLGRLPVQAKVTIRFLFAKSFYNVESRRVMRDHNAFLVRML
jgi:hypothetical protein